MHKFKFRIERVKECLKKITQKITLDSHICKLEKKRWREPEDTSFFHTFLATHPDAHGLTQVARISVCAIFKMRVLLQSSELEGHF